MRLMWVAAATAAGVLTLSAGADDLNPPAGPVAPTGATSILEAPFTITEPGSYRVARDLTVGQAVDGITISTSDVTLDLGGHTLDGQGIGVHGIVVPGDRKNVVIRNGTLANWTSNGVFLSSSTGVDGGILEDLRIRDVEGVGIRDSGGSPPGKITIRRCRVDGAGAQGIWVRDRAVIESCEVTPAAGAGVQLGAHGVVSDSLIYENTGDGITGGAHNTIRDTRIALNGGDGVSLGDDASIRRAEVEENDEVGIQAGDRSVIADSTVNGNGTDGVSADFNSSVARCTINGNGDVGARLSGGASISWCHVADNGGIGIRVTNRARVIHNTVSFNQGGGVLSSVGNHAIMDNSFFSNGGFAIDSQGPNGSLIIRNTNHGVQDFNFNAFDQGAVTSDAATAGPTDNIVH